MTGRPITPERFDKSQPIPKPKIIWGLDGIGQRIGRSGDFVRGTLFYLPKSPVQKVGNRYCADEGELMNFFRSHPIDPD